MLSRVLENKKNEPTKQSHCHHHISITVVAVTSQATGGYTGRPSKEPLLQVKAIVTDKRTECFDSDRSKETFIAKGTVTRALFFLSFVFFSRSQL